MLAAIVFAALAAAAPLNPPAPSSRNPQAQQQAAPAQERQDTGANKRGTESAPLVVQIAQPEGHEAIATKSEEEGHWYALPDWWVAGFTGALFVATSGLWFVTWLLWSSTKRLVMHESENSKLELRAYLSAQLNEIMLEEDGKTIRAFVRVLNSGQTPAFRVKTPSAINVLEAPPARFDIADELAFTDEQLANLPVFTLAKGDNTVNSPNSEIPSIENVLQTSENQALYVFGLITYCDVFGEDHWLEFCGFLPRDEYLRAFQKAEQNRGKKIKASFQVPSFGNDASFNPDHAEAMKEYRQGDKRRFRPRLTL